MMYSEFLRIGGEKVKNISFTEYSEMVEPLYLYCDIEKHIFVERLVNHFEEDSVKMLIYWAFLKIETRWKNV